MIIIGYQGIGKSSCAGKDNCIDLESGNFWIDGMRHDDWYITYAKIANHLSEQGYTVFVSSHEVVRKELEKSKEKVYIIHPSIYLKEDWIKRLQERYDRTGTEKDFKALANAKDRYVENIMELKMSNIKNIEISNIDYDLRDIIKTLN